jgi:hypothetical protein
MDPTSQANLLAALLARLGQIPPQEQQSNDNSSLNKIFAPSENISLTDQVTFTAGFLGSFKWGGTGVTAGWTWGAGQWDESSSGGGSDTAVMGITQ